MFVIKEVEDYLARPREKDFRSVSSYWGDQIIQTKYPNLAQLFLKFGSAPATSCESERLFSIVNLTLDDLRKTLNGEHLEKLVFLHHNLLINGFLKEIE